MGSVRWPPIFLVVIFNGGSLLLEVDGGSSFNKVGVWSDLVDSVAFPPFTLCHRGGSMRDGGGSSFNSFRFGALSGKRDEWLR